MAKIQKVQPLVLEALENKPETRKDDFLLVYEVLKNFVTGEMPLSAICKHHVELGLPSFASIIRIRRILQTKYPHLADAAAQAVRSVEQEEFKAYALNNK
jgi:hypothetical protein